MEFSGNILYAWCGHALGTTSHNDRIHNSSDRFCSVFVWCGSQFLHCFFQQSDNPAQCTFSHSVSSFWQPPFCASVNPSFLCNAMFITRFISSASALTKHARCCALNSYSFHLVLPHQALILILVIRQVLKENFFASKDRPAKGQK